VRVTELLDVTQALERRRIDNADCDPVEADRVPQRIANDDVVVHMPDALLMRITTLASL
jgi:hypothetical protein